jgi:predicted nucleic acid-binding protein
MEFYLVLTRKLSPAVPRGVAQRHIEDLVRSWEVVPLDGAVILEALRGVIAHGFAPWDAQIWAAARLSRVGSVLSEDFSDGMFAEGVRFANPFVPSFQLASLG